MMHPSVTSDYTSGGDDGNGDDEEVITHLNQEITSTPYDGTVERVLQRYAEKTINKHNDRP